MQLKTFSAKLAIFAQVYLCDTGPRATDVSFLRGSIGSCEPRRQEAVWVSDNHSEWTMLQIGLVELTRMLGLMGKACRNSP